MDVKISRKRSRESDLTDCTDCLPLSKRINSLSIDTSHFPVPPERLFHINVDVEQNQSCNVIPQTWQPPIHSPEYLTSTSFSSQNHNHLPGWSQSNSHRSNALSQQTSSHEIHSSFPDGPSSLPSHQSSEQQWNSGANSTHASWVSSLKYGHDHVDSEYYVNNRLLFNLYLERISRTGQPPANPY